MHLKFLDVLVETVKVLILRKPAKRFIWHLRVQEPRVRKVDLAAGGGGEKIYEIQHNGDYRTECQVRPFTIYFQGAKNPSGTKFERF